MISWIIIPGVIGALFCALNKSFAANCIWSISNLLLIFYNLQNNDISQAVLFGVYEVIAIFGVLKHLSEQYKIKNLAC